MNNVTTDHLDYLQRIDALGGVSLPYANGNRPLLRMQRIAGVSRWRNGEKAGSGELSADGQNRLLLPTEDLIAGLYGSRVPLAFSVEGGPAGVNISCGSWLVPHSDQDLSRLQERITVITSAWHGLFPNLTLETPQPEQGERYSRAGLVLGHPTLKHHHGVAHGLPWDRLIRALQGVNWGVLILAEPVASEFIHDLRALLLNESRGIGAQAKAELAPNPLANQYQALIETKIGQLNQAHAAGGWRTAIYLLGNNGSYDQLSAAWLAAFAGDMSSVEPLQIIESDQFGTWANNWQMPNEAVAPGPGHWRHPFQFQNFLNAAQLATYVHLPGRETAGFQIREVAPFDVVPPATAGPTINLGTVLQGAQQTPLGYELSETAFNRHVFVSGLTGSGKTNTVFHLLKQLWGRRRPFLVLEPAKTEYRALLADTDLRRSLRIYTLGIEGMGPFRLNPLAFPPGISVATHIDMLKSVFNAAFGMWTPLPQVLERCLHEVYADFGWDTIRGSNRRLKANDPEHIRNQALPRLRDLYAKVALVVDRLGYDEKVASDIKAALLTRLHSLCIGGKGAMLDTNQEVPMDQLLRYPTIIELDAIGDDDEKAFLMGLLLIRIVEQLRTDGIQPYECLRHMIVVEEAHRLLANVSPHADQEQANVRGKAVEMFANLLTEMRAYGESFVIADQVPTKLAPDVIKNTNIKVAHRIVSGDDREVLGMAMNMNEPQREHLATLTVGQAALYAEGDDRPVLVKMPLAKFQRESGEVYPATDDAIARQMKRIREHWGDPEQLAPFLRECRPEWFVDWRRLGRLYDEPIIQRAMSRLILSSALVESTAPLRLMINGYLATTRRFLPTGASTRKVDPAVLLQGIQWYFTYYGAAYYWPYARTWQLKQLAADLLLKASTVNGPAAEELKRFQDAYAEASRSIGPLPACRQICPANQCLYRQHAKQLLHDFRLSEPFEDALGLAGELRFWSDTIALPLAGDELLERAVPDEQRQAAAYCYGQQMILNHSVLLENRKIDAIAVMLEGPPAELVQGESHE